MTYQLRLIAPYSLTLPACPALLYDIRGFIFAHMSVTTASDVREALQPLVPRLRSLGVRRLGFFGSVARNEANDGSDVDMLVEFAPASRSYDNFFTVGELLERAVGRRVELVTPESLSRHIGPYILREIRYVDVGSGVSPPHS